MHLLQVKLKTSSQVDCFRLPPRVNSIRTKIIKRFRKRAGSFSSIKFPVYWSLKMIAKVMKLSLKYRNTLLLKMPLKVTFSTKLI